MIRRETAMSLAESPSKPTLNSCRIVASDFTVNLLTDLVPVLVLCALQFLRRLTHTSTHTYTIHTN